MLGQILQKLSHIFNKKIKLMQCSLQFLIDMQLLKIINISYKFVLPKMCQCLVCDCWWCNIFGVCCGGLHQSFFLISYWCCKPQQLKSIDPQCCHICEWTGIGGNCFCIGDICCAPHYVKQFSHRGVGTQRNIVVIQQNSNADNYQRQ